MDAKRLVGVALEKALVAQAPLARKNVERLRRVHPEATPSALIKKLDVAYLSAVTVSGGTAGAAGMVPGGVYPPPSPTSWSSRRPPSSMSYRERRFTAFIPRTSNGGNSWPTWFLWGTVPTPRLGKPSHGLVGTGPNASWTVFQCRQ